MAERLLTVQWSYDQQQWYSYGYRTGKIEHTVISTLDEARKTLDILMTTHHARYFRIIDTLGEVVLEKEHDEISLLPSKVEDV